MADGLLFTLIYSHILTLAAHRADTERNMVYPSKHDVAIFAWFPQKNKKYNQRENAVF